MSVFLSYNADDACYSLTGAGTAMFIAITVVLILLVAFIKRSITDTAASNKEDAATKSSVFSTRQLVFSAVALALAFVLSYVKILHMPWGGSVTLCSMLFVVLIGYWYGPNIGLICALAYGMLQFIQGGGGYILSPLQACLDYILAFTALGLSGFFHNKKNGLLIGYIIAIVARGILHSIGGYIYWMDYMPESFPANLSAIYPLCYNFSYILLEGVLTVIIIMLPPVKKGLDQIKRMATEG